MLRRIFPSIVLAVLKNIFPDIWKNNVANTPVWLDRETAKKK